MPTPLPTFDELSTKIVNFVTASDKTDKFVNGTAAETVPTASGTFPTIAGIVKSFEGQKCLYVSKGATATNDRTGIPKWSMLKPFASITSAIAAAVAGEMVVVLDGIYQENDLGKNGVNLFFADGSGVVSYSNEGTSGFMFKSNAIDFKVLGHGLFTAYTVSGTSGFLYNEGSGSDIYIEGREIKISLQGGFSDPYATAYMVLNNGTNNNIEFNFPTYIFDLSDSGRLYGVYLSQETSNVVVRGQKLMTTATSEDPSRVITAVYCGSGKVDWFISETSIISSYTEVFYANNITSIVRVYGDSLKCKLQGGSIINQNNNGRVVVRIKEGYLDQFSVTPNAAHIVSMSSGWDAKVYFHADKFSCRSGAGIASLQSYFQGLLELSGYIEILNYSVAIRDYNSNVTIVLNRVTIAMEDWAYGYWYYRYSGTSYNIYVYNSIVGGLNHLNGGNLTGPTPMIFDNSFHRLVP